ncbi:immune inhibitor A [bacterium]|nr:immune inhibitor A [bacterium]
MNSRTMVFLAVGLMLTALATGVAARDLGLGAGERGSHDLMTLEPSGTGDHEFRGARLETLWIFEADFENLLGNNAGWTSYDMSGTLGQENYWHKDTIRISGHPTMGDSTWWCGTYSDCWLQDRGYANNWTQLMSRELPLSTWSVGGDVVVLEFDQRYAMENDYDYGYVEISDDGGTTWTTIYTANNGGFAGKPGPSRDWDALAPHGHQSLSLNTWAGIDIELRFRFESDVAYSAQDEYNNGPPNNSVLDGAWQLDNFDVTVNTVSAWSDDVEAAGDNGWIHVDTVQSGQVGNAFRRALYGAVDGFDTGAGFTCENRTGWMYGATDPFSKIMIDGQKTYLISPPIDVSGADRLVGLWDMWVDLPLISNNRFDLWLASHDNQACVTSLDGFQDENPGGWYGGPFWGIWADDWDAFAGNDWLAVEWQLENDDPAAPGSHRAGILLTRQWVGIPSGDAGTSFTYGTWDRFNDWYFEQMAEALLDSAEIMVKDADDINTVTLMASDDDGATWSAYACRRLDPLGNDRKSPPPIDQMNAGSEIHYYFEATDGVGTIATYPSTAPDAYFEFSILPITATIEEPGILLVDKHSRGTPGAERNYLHNSIYYYREALSILGYEWETYDVEVPSGTANSEGPDFRGYKYYDTIIWVTNEFNSFTFWNDPDLLNITNWLNQAGAGEERNFLVTGNDWCYELIDSGVDSIDFVTEWLAADYVQTAVGDVEVDSLPTLRDHAGGTTFMDHEDGACILTGGCPDLMEFDVIQPSSGSGAEIVAEYVKLDASTLPAGVAYTHPTLQYQTVALGFGVEFMMDSLDPSTGYYNTGLADRVNLMGNILAYFNKTPTTNPTDVPVPDGYRNMLAHAHPNPFNPTARIAYSIREAGHVTIEVYNIAGKVVRTLLESELDAGTTGFVMWDGTDDTGAKCSSGVYFYRMIAPGFIATQKMVMLK